MTTLDAYESALLLIGIARTELRGKADLRAQLACIRLGAAEEALQGKVDMQAYEAKIMGTAHQPSGERS